MCETLTHGGTGPNKTQQGAVFLTNTRAPLNAGSSPLTERRGRSSAPSISVFLLFHRRARRLSGQTCRRERVSLACCTMLQYPHQPPQQQPVHQQQSEPSPEMRLREPNDSMAPSKTASSTHNQSRPSSGAAPATTRNSRKRKGSPHSANTPPQPSSQPPPPPSLPAAMHTILSSPHAIMHHGIPTHPPIYQYAPPEFSQPPPQGEQSHQAIDGPLDQIGQLKTGPGGRQLSQSKRAEQNRKAQRAFRERRDQ